MRVAASMMGGGPREPADPPPGHRVGLGDAVDHDAAVTQLRRRSEGMDVLAVMDERTVDIVGDDPDVALRGPRGDRGPMPGVVGGAGRVGRIGEDDCARAGHPRRLEGLDGHAVAPLGVGEHLACAPVCRLHRGAVSRPARRADQHRVLGPREDRVEGEEKGVLGAEGDEHVIGRPGLTSAGGEALGDDAPQVGET
jgi:hypothetical protein